MDDSDLQQELADSLLAGKEEEVKEDEKVVEENKTEDDTSKDESSDDKDSKEESKDGDKASDDKSKEEKPAEKADDTKEEPKPADDKQESDTAEEAKPLTREDVRAALREEAEQREAATAQRQSFAGQVRNDLKEALKLDSTFTTVALDDGTPITSISQLTQVINPETDEPYTRDEAAQLLLDARKIVDENIAAYESRVDELTDLNVNFKEEADEVDRRFGHILKAFPEEAKSWLEAYRKTFKTNEDGTYVENVPISPLEFYEPLVRPFMTAAAQVEQRQAEERAAAEKAAKEAENKAEQEDRSDLGASAGAKSGKPDLLGDAIDKYLEDN